MKVPDMEEAMPPDCGAVHPKLADVQCTLEKHAGENHTFKDEHGEINWTGTPKKPTVYTRAQLEQVIGDHEIKLQQTMDTIQSSHGVARDLINTLVPPMQTQLFLIKEVLKLVKE